MNLSFFKSTDNDKDRAKLSLNSIAETLVKNNIVTVVVNRIWIEQPLLRRCFTLTSHCNVCANVLPAPTPRPPPHPIIYSKLKCCWGLHYYIVFLLVLFRIFQSQNHLYNSYIVVKPVIFYFLHFITQITNRKSSSSQVSLFPYDHVVIIIMTPPPPPPPAKAGGRTYCFSADPVGGGVGVASCPHSISLLNGHI